ncbi:MAG: GIY-YIG nuclease family protein [Eubacteriaceae bacterium]|nr:GIY-YIG nuclease family protein [Eubacteriaceae bacterium]
MTKKFYTYMLRCADDSLYVGYTVNLERRLKTHNAGKGAKYTRSRLPVTLAYAECFDNKHDAMSREANLKKLRHQERERLILEHQHVRDADG